MMYLCQFGQNLATGSDVQTRFFIELYDPGNFEN